MPIGNVFPEPNDVSPQQRAAQPFKEDGGGFLDFIRKIAGAVVHPVGTLENFANPPSEEDASSLIAEGELQRQYLSDQGLPAAPVKQWTPDLMKQANLSGGGNIGEDTAYSPFGNEKLDQHAFATGIDIAGKDRLASEEYNRSVQPLSDETLTQQLELKGTGPTQQTPKTPQQTWFEGLSDDEKSNFMYKDSGGYQASRTLPVLGQPEKDSVYNQLSALLEGSTQKDILGREKPTEDIGSLNILAQDLATSPGVLNAYGGMENLVTDVANAYQRTGSLKEAKKLLESKIGSL